MKKILLKRDRYLRDMPMSKVFIIAEAGVNHNGSLELAKKLIDVAVEAGADAVKFQTFKADKLVSKHAQKADYQKQTTSTDESQYDMIKKLELDDNAHRVLIGYSKDKKIMFLSTPFDHNSIDLLNSFQMPIFKIPSGEITNLPYLRHVGHLGKDVILSTGMANLDEVQDALEVLIKAGTSKEKITVLHATTEYPCPIDEVNLRAMHTISTAFGIKVGYSDHTQGIEVPIAAAALGACVIEKHFTLDRTMEGPDHKASLEPGELKEMVQAIRHIEKAMGDGIKRPSESERKNISVARKSILASRSIEIGETFSDDNLIVKRPGNGISPMRWDEIIGHKATRNFSVDELIEL
jgi:N,N'-diacetyllegionaminate synthase